MCCLVFAVIPCRKCVYDGLLLFFFYLNKNSVAILWRKDIIWLVISEALGCTELAALILDVDFIVFCFSMIQVL